MRQATAGPTGLGVASVLSTDSRRIQREHRFQSGGEQLFLHLALLLLSGAGLVFYFPLDASALVDLERGAESLQFVYVGLYAIAAVLAVRGYRTAEWRWRGIGVLFALVLLAPLSSLWSAAPDLTLRRGVALVLTTAFAVYLAGAFSEEQLVKTLTRSLCLAAFVSIVVVFVWPDYGVGDLLYEGAWRGVFTHKNVFGRVLALLGVAVLCLPRIGPWTRALCFFVILLLIVMSSSQSAFLILTAVGAVRLTMVRTLRGGFGVAASVCLAAACVVALASEIGTHLGDSAALLGRDLTLTGRTYLWDLALDAIAARWTGGAGYGAFWITGVSNADDIRSAAGWLVPHAHNGFLDIALELGAPAAMTLVLMVLWMLVRALKYASSEGTALSCWPASYILFFLLYNLTESTTMRQNTLFWVLFVHAGMVLAGKQLRRGGRTELTRFVGAECNRTLKAVELE